MGTGPPSLGRHALYLAQKRNLNRCFLRRDSNVVVSLCPFHSHLLSKVHHIPLAWKEATREERSPEGRLLAARWEEDGRSGYEPDPSVRGWHGGAVGDAPGSACGSSDPGLPAGPEARAERAGAAQRQAAGPVSQILSQLRPLLWPSLSGGKDILSLHSTSHGNVYKRAGKSVESRSHNTNLSQYHFRTTGPEARR